ncbi:MAG: hypothetical protein ACYSVY_23140, partial [Planctomycetota bacterium]
MYYHLHDDDSHQAMMALAESGDTNSFRPTPDSPPEGGLRATGRSRIETTPQVSELQEVVACPTEASEREGF